MSRQVTIIKIWFAAQSSPEYFFFPCGIYACSPNIFEKDFVRCEQVLGKWGLTTWVRMWFFMSLFRENNLLHMTHEKRFSPVWLRICLVRLLLTANGWPHMSHLKGFSFVCNRIWVFRLQFCVNDVLQSEQVYGFLEQDLLSNKQGYGFWSPWPLICFLKEELQANDLLYCEHEYGFYMSAHMNLHFMI